MATTALSPQSLKLKSLLDDIVDRMIQADPIGQGAILDYPKYKDSIQNAANYPVEYKDFKQLLERLDVLEKEIGDAVSETERADMFIARDILNQQILTFECLDLERYDPPALARP